MPEKKISDVTYMISGNDNTLYRMNSEERVGIRYFVENYGADDLLNHLAQMTTMIIEERRSLLMGHDFAGTPGNNTPNKSIAEECMEKLKV